MRTEKRDWDFVNNSALKCWKYEPINKSQAVIEGSGKVWDDMVKVGDGIILATKDGNKCILHVEEISFNNEVFKATVTLGERIKT